MLDQTCLMARVLYGAGARQNDVISIVSENRFEYPAVTFGAFYLGVIVAPCSVTYTERKLFTKIEVDENLSTYMKSFFCLHNGKAF